MPWRFEIYALMRIRTEATPLDVAVVVTPESFEDQRGFFYEAFREDVYREAGLPIRVVQLNHSKSAKGVIRGLHFQWEPPMGKLMRVTQGRAFLVCVDLRVDSPTLGKWFGREFDAAKKQALWAPASFARGFCALTDAVEIEYLCTGTYNGPCESGILWNDPAIGITWPIKDPTLSDRDRAAQTLAQWLARPESRRFTR